MRYVWSSDVGSTFNAWTVLIIDLVALMALVANWTEREHRKSAGGSTIVQVQETHLTSRVCMKG